MPTRELKSFASERQTLRLPKSVTVELRTVAYQLGAAELGDLLAAWVNTSGSKRDAETAAAAIMQAHPTLQALVVRFLLDLLMSYEPTSTDQRNEAPAFVCAMLRQLRHEDPGHFYIPLI